MGTFRCNFPTVGEIESSRFQHYDPFSLVSLLCRTDHRQTSGLLIVRKAKRSVYATVKIIRVQTTSIRLGCVYALMSSFKRMLCCVEVDNA